MSRFKEIVGGDNPIKYEMRAAPRRRIKGEDADDQPVFLRKAFVMMSSCPPEIGGWSEKGDTVVVKDVKLFAEKIIPTAYKHNNFSSFVRQLNFYGFRKIKSENPDHAAWWEFRHPNFLRDQPHLLADIKRSVHYVNDSPNVHEVSELKAQVGSLTDRISALHEQIEFLTGAVTQIQLGGEHKSRASTYDGDDLSTSSTNADSANKKRKVNADVRIKSEPTLSVDSSAEAEGDGAFNLMRMCSLESSFDLAVQGEQLPTGPELQSLGLFRGSSVQSLNGAGSSGNNGGADASFTFDEEEAAWGADMERLLTLSETLVDQDRSSATSANVAVAADEQLDSKAAYYQPYCSTGSVAALPVNAEKEQVVRAEYADLPHASMVSAHNVFPAPTAPAPSEGVRDLFSLLESLSPELKIRFVDRLAEVMGRQLSANMSTAAVPTAAIAVAGGGDSLLPPSSSSSSCYAGPSPAQSFAQLTRGSNAPFHLPSGGEAPEIALPLASAALGAFVMSSLNSLVLNQQQTEAAAARNRLA